MRALISDLRERNTPLTNEAADEIERLERSNADLGEALQLEQQIREAAWNETQGCIEALGGGDDDGPVTLAETRMEELRAAEDEVELSRPALAALREIVERYDNYRKRGMLPAREEYAAMVEAIEFGRRALAEAEGK